MDCGQGVTKVAPNYYPHSNLVGFFYLQMQQQEQWLPVKGYEGYYEVSNLGQVRSVDREIRNTEKSTRLRAGRILKLGITKKYPYAPLWKDNKGDTPLVHRLVATAFLDNPENKPCVNHKDGIKFNNNVDNLEWVTMKENTQHALDTGLLPRGELHPNTKLSNKQVEEIKALLLAKVRVKDISDKYGLSISYVYSIRSGKQRKIV